MVNVDEMMERHGFTVSASCAGPAWYTKFLEYKGKRAYITVTDRGGDGLPTTLDEPVVVGIYDRRSGDELETCQNFTSLESYLESLEE